MCGGGRGGACGGDRARGGARGGNRGRGREGGVGAKPEGAKVQKKICTKIPIENSGANNRTLGRPHSN